MMDPKVWDYHYWLGVSFEDSGNVAAARTQYRQALQENPESKEAQSRLASLEAK
jgi:Flp pilus assembly protein TadD